MSPRHHPSIEILTAYASGVLEPGFGLVVGAHLEACGHCRSQARALQAASGEALRQLPEMDLAEGALARAMSRLDEPALAPAPADRREILHRLPLRAKRWVAPGVWVAAVDTPHAADNRVYVLRVGAGAATARHAHSGMEFCTVLKGAYRDEVGLFRAGDFAAAESDLNHRPVIEGDEECICLFATEGRLKPQGMLGQVAFAIANV